MVLFYYMRFCCVLFRVRRIIIRFRPCPTTRSTSKTLRSSIHLYWLLAIPRIIRLVFSLLLAYPPIEFNLVLRFRMFQKNSLAFVVMARIRWSTATRSSSEQSVLRRLAGIFQVCYNGILNCHDSTCIICIILVGKQQQMPVSLWTKMNLIKLSNKWAILARYVHYHKLGQYFSGTRPLLICECQFEPNLILLGMFATARRGRAYPSRSLASFWCIWWWRRHCGPQVVFQRLDSSLWWRTWSENSCSFRSLRRRHRRLYLTRTGFLCCAKHICLSEV